MSEFQRINAQADIPTVTLELVPEDEAERKSWEVRRQRLQENRHANAETERKLSAERMKNLRLFEEAQERPLRRFLRWIGL